MAFTVKFTDPLTGHPRYNIDQSLRGFVRPASADAMLVQVLLNLLYFDLSSVSVPLGHELPTGRLQGPLKVDGLIELETLKLINHSADVFLKNGRGVLNPVGHPEALGVDPMRVPGEPSPRLKIRFYIDILNEEVSVLDADIGLNKYAFLRFDPTLPRLLLNSLKTVKSKANKYAFER